MGSVYSVDPLNKRTTHTLDSIKWANTRFNHTSQNGAQCRSNELLHCVYYFQSLVTEMETATMDKVKLVQFLLRLASLSQGSQSLFSTFQSLSSSSPSSVPPEGEIWIISFTEICNLVLLPWVCDTWLNNGPCEPMSTLSAANIPLAMILEMLEADVTGLSN